MKLLLLGLFILVVAIVRPADNIYANGIQTAGTVKTFGKNLLDRRMREIVVEYRDAGQQPHELSKKIYTFETIFRHYQPGKSVIVAYDSNNPSHAVLYTWEGRYSRDFGAIIGIALMLTGGYQLRRKTSR
jgi:hypothetical protein